MKKPCPVLLPLLCATVIFSVSAVIDSGPWLQTAQASPKSVPQWIWLGNPTDSNETVYFRRVFDLSSVPESATVAGSCDNSMRVFINGKKAVSSNEWATPVRAKISKILKKGRNIIAVEAVNRGGPGGLILSLDSWVGTPRGGKKSSPILSTDSAWKASRKTAKGWRAPDFNDSQWKNSTSIAEIGGGPWGGRSCGRKRPAPKRGSCRPCPADNKDCCRRHDRSRRAR